MTNGVGLPISGVSSPVSKDQEPCMYVTLALVASTLAFYPLGTGRNIDGECGVVLVPKSNLGHT